MSVDDERKEGDSKCLEDRQGLLENVVEEGSGNRRSRFPHQPVIFYHLSLNMIYFVLFQGQSSCQSDRAGQKENV